MFTRIKEFYDRYLAWINAYWLVTIAFLIVTLTVGDSSLYKRYTYDENGNMYVRPLRPVLIGSRSTVGGLWDEDYEIDVAAYNETAEERGAAEVTHIYLGQGDDAILLWEEGMGLPAASAADEA